MSKDHDAIQSLNDEGELDINNLVENLDLSTVAEDPLDKKSLELVGDDDTADIEVVADPTEGNQLCELLDASVSASTVYDQLIKEAAEEVAYLKETRKLQYRARINHAGTSEKRMKGLKTLGDLCALKDKEVAALMGGNIDFRSEGFSKVFEFFLGKVGETLLDTLSSSIGDPKAVKKVNSVFFAKLQKSLDGFETVAEEIYKTGKLPSEDKKSSGEVKI